MVLLEAINDELERRGVYKYKIYSPYFVSSFAMHEFNLVNQENKIYYEGGRLPNSRLHLIFVAPAGFMKTFFIEQFIGNDNPILPVNKVFVQKITEAGLVGTYTNVVGLRERSKGIVEEFATGIIGIDEFTAITTHIGSANSNGLDTQLLSILDSGRVNKALANGKISYTTYCTIWGAIQPSRFDISSGLGRRFLFMAFYPSKKDADELIDHIYRTKNVKSNGKEMDKIQKEIIKFRQRLKTIQSIEFDESMIEYYKKKNTYPYEVLLFDRLALGYTLATTDFGRNIVISIDEEKELKRILDKSFVWRRQIVLGSEHRIIVKMLKENNNMMKLSDLIKDCVMVGWDYKKTMSILREMKENSMIVMREGKIVLTGWIE